MRLVPTVTCTALAVCVVLISGSRDADPVAPLPSGTYFRDWRGTCPDCARPRFAVIAGVAADIAGTRALVAHVAADDLPLGYPMVAHTSEVGLVDAGRGVVVVAGLFERRRDALAWVTRHEAWPPSVRVVVLMPDARYQASLIAGDVEARVVEIDHTRAAVPAFAADPPPPRPADPNRVDPMRVVHDDRVPLCVVHAGDRFIRTSAELYDLMDFRWVSVPCGDQVGFVRITDTLLHATSRVQHDGTRVLRQVVNVVCDGATMMEWRWGREGRIGAGVVVQRPGADCDDP